MPSNISPGKLEILAERKKFSRVFPRNILSWFFFVFALFDASSLSPSFLEKGREKRIHVGVSGQTFDDLEITPAIIPDFSSNISPGPSRFIVFDSNGGDDDNVAQVECVYTWSRAFSSLFSLRQTLMADRGALSLPRASTYLSFSNLHVWRFHNPRSYPPSRSQLLCFSSSCSRVTSAKIIQLNRRRFSYKICAAADDGRGYRLTERGKRGRKRRELWEELFEDNVEDDDDEDDGGGGIGSANFDLWKILEEIVDNVWILKVISFNHASFKP